MVLPTMIMGIAVFAIAANCATPTTHEKTTVKETTTTTTTTKPTTTTPNSTGTLDNVGNKIKSATNTAVQTTKIALFELVDKESIKINFKPASAEVSPGEQRDLKALIVARQKKGPIEKVI